MKRGASLRRDEGCIYLCFHVVANSISLASPRAAKLTHFVAPPFPTKSLILRGAPSASRILLFKNPAFVSPWCHKIRLSYCRRKVSVNRYLPVKQMAKSAPFPRQPEAKVSHTRLCRAKSCAKVDAVPFGYPCQGQRCFPLDTLCQQGCSRPFWMTQSRKAGAALLWKPPEFFASVSIQTAKSQWGYHALKIKKDRTLFHE